MDEETKDRVVEELGEKKETVEESGDYDFENPIKRESRASIRESVAMRSS